MAKRVHEVLEDDLDGGQADETVSFALDGVSYEIDLSAGNAGKLRDALAPFIGHARKAGRRGGRAAGGRASGRRTGGRGTSTAQIREWARAKGHKVSDRGRINADILRAYEAEH